MRALYDRLARLQSPMAKVAAQLGRARPQYLGCRLSPLVLMSDRARTPDLEALAEGLPRGAALIYREALGAHDAKLARHLRRITHDRGVQFLIGADAALAEAVGADGVHLPGAGSRDKSVPPHWIVTQAAPKDGTVPDMARLDALFVSSVFASQSPSAGTPLGVPAFSSRVAAAPCAVIALGGVTAETAPTLLGTGAAGLASIDGLANEIRRGSMQSAAHTPDKGPNKGQGPIEAKPNSNVTIAKDEGGELITYTATVAGESATGELTLRRIADGVWNANHTGVPNEIGGRGVGKSLVLAMVEDARMQGWTIKPGCPFVAKLFERHPEWAEGIT